MWMISKLIDVLFPSRCLRCGKKETPLCSRCVQLLRRSLASPSFFITSTFDFRDETVRRAIHAIKYYHRTDLIEPLATMLAHELHKDDISSYTLVPIPMPWKRKLIRGYNQAELIALSLSKKLSLPVRNDILIRTHSPSRQAIIHDRTSRLSNQVGSFACSNDVEGMHILLIDDVATTGATLEEAKKILGKRGAIVKAATLAH